MIYTINNLFINTNEKSKTKLPEQITINGWIRSNRNGKNVGFLDINDGSSVNNLQAVYNMKIENWKACTNLTTGSAVSVSGNLLLTPGKSQPFELQITNIIIYNVADTNYPIQKKEHTNEFLRDNAHLRGRTNTFLAVFKIRDQVSWAIHKFFHEQNFVYLHSPIITANDAEGAGENFIVTTITNNKYQDDFFGQKASLTVSGQLNAEAYAQSLQKVYTFGPTFRAENSNTSRHAAEFWMIEPEFTFANLQDNIKLAQQLIKSVINDVLDNCLPELTWLEQKQVTKGQILIEKLKVVAGAKSDFKVITYSEVIDLLINAQTSGKEFEFKDIKWGIDLQSEHERYLCEEITKQPTFVINYPQSIKAFYMKLNAMDINHPEQKTVAAMDLLVPGIGELIGGSVREDNYEQLLSNKKQFKIAGDDLQWYFDLRKYGYAPSAGFGLGLERLLMFITGISNIRDVIPFPRTPNNLSF
ncbi:asparagine--tRNA ligase [Spiroplasma sp. AdecLV25b]|uniref:asparagine--tRNA ligase n=1 Tax=Spiroplasma sp. AdecLV25b TaxID=3027162 RepID=UPI0027E099E4|nr:asparagine--tRNA ligase [Spiroplasma sp. AdecLV25b]